MQMDSQTSPITGLSALASLLLVGTPRTQIQRGDLVGAPLEERGFGVILNDHQVRGARPWSPANSAHPIGCIASPVPPPPVQPNPQSASPNFPATAWSVVQGARDADHADFRPALERLVSVYWRPIYWTLRHEWKASPEEARDCTQEYFSVFLERDYLQDVVRERGRFRAFVKATLRHFMLNLKREERALKRGGAFQFIPVADLEQAESDPADREAEPERLFERELMRSIIARSLRDLKASCERENHLDHFELFHTYYVEESAGRRLRYVDLKEQFDCGPHEVKNRLADLRTRFRKIVLGHLRDGVSSEQELLTEIQEVFER
jgi:DNA-directed RNA polymerase specialized sigma24 family protein